MDPLRARAVWHHLETLNAVTYFSIEARRAASDLGLKGFWMGYFACRAAPMGAVTAAVVDAAFFNFNPDRVARAIPDAWNLTSPSQAIDARATAASAALRRLLGDDVAEQLAIDVTPALDRCIERAVGAGRALFVANRDVARSDDPVASLWQAATTLREHRGDGHVALLTGAALDGCEVHVLFAGAADAAPDPGLLQQSRGWTHDEWRAASERLAARGLVDAEGAPTAAGRGLHEDIERRTDELAVLPYEPLGDAGVDELLRQLRPAYDRIAAADEIPYPNPMGLPQPARSRDRD